ncbi:MAG: ABC transporter substrate-binding protein [Deltaproteobacteria bacterium]|nr:ABC transporter substrate-binding protein [Deltaproteobacteria bacterium]MBW1962918.1 ABC transporter substrate-binding protein [Deltaproteobacteria bacterium]MBW1995032.1 ABC transporter substrate-binding protein [Deltaproteobacteria bacterium]MBW2150992.1 ABC transporter substrate-binding protein [Deltaproteobacteria bacterium]
MRKLLVCLIFGLLILQIHSASASAPQRGGHLIVCQPAEPPGLDPTANTAAAIDRVVYSNIYEGLVKVNRNGQYVPGLASGWEVSSDGKVYSFKLRRGVRFHNGEPFNAEVAKWNIERAKAEGTVNPHPEYFRGIYKIETPDEFTLVLSLKEVDALFIPHMAEGDAVMLPMKGYETAKSNPIGTGPFRFVKWVRGDRVEMVRNDAYWNPQLPYLDRVTFKFIGDPGAQIAALKAGDIDVIGYIAAPESAMLLSKDKRFKVYAGTTTGEVIMSTNNKAKPFDNKLVRQAMAYAIDRKTLVDLVMFGYGTPIGSHWSPSTPYYRDLTGKFPYDPEKARALLAKAGYPDGFHATIKLPAIYSYSKRSGEVIADMLADIGIKLEIEIVEWGQWIERVFKKKEYQLTLIGHVEPWDIGIYANPDYYFQYDSQEFRDAYAKALRATTESEKAKWFGICQEIIAEDAVSGYLFSAPSLAVMRKEVMNWWENYPTVALDCTEVWLNPN